VFGKMRILEYISRIAPSIAYWKILLYSIVILAVFEGILYVLNKKRTEKIKPNRLYVYGLVFYSNFVLRLTLLGREIGSKKVDVIRLNFSVEEIFSSHGILNMLLFAPFGFLLYAIIKNYNVGTKVLLTFLVSMAFSILIEMVQLATLSGRFEINDMVANSLGGLIGCFPGYIVFDLLLKKDEEDVDW